MLDGLAAKGQGQRGHEVPDCARFAAKILCPNCGAHQLNSVRCSWGILPGPEYQAGDSIQWLRDQSGNVRKPFELHKVGGTKWRWNCGGPDFPDVDLFDEDVYTGNHELICPDCGLWAAACVVSIRGGIVSEVKILHDQEVDEILGPSRDRAHVVVIDRSGARVPREDWFDHPVAHTED